MNGKGSERLKPPQNLPVAARPETWLTGPIALDADGNQLGT
ncbi:MAG TPA: hypothetical protein VGQ40_00320 [Chthoniobacterales bacterium]|nr:hypothetical protein [Chthoniobacterales bacterium]